jgi:23S rRNA (uracil1939-C5)-methyltransferase
MSKRGGRALRDARAAKSPAARLRNVPETVATLRIESVAAGGDGVGRIDGLACFVPRTAPGDLVQVAIKTHARHARGRVLQLLEASTLRVEATCRHYDADRCGGCQLQHVSEAAQRDARRTIVRDALRRIGKRDVELPELVSGASWAYRGRLTLTLRARSQGWVGGLHPFDDASRVFALEECAIAHPSLVAARARSPCGLAAACDTFRRWRGARCQWRRGVARCECVGRHADACAFRDRRHLVGTR